MLAQRYALTDVERSGALRGLIEGGELSGYGLANAVTHYSQQIADYDPATEFEVIGGRMVELLAEQWRKLNEMA